MPSPLQPAQAVHEYLVARLSEVAVVEQEIVASIPPPPSPMVETPSRVASAETSFASEVSFVFHLRLCPESVVDIRNIRWSFPIASMPCRRGFQAMSPQQYNEALASNETSSPTFSTVSPTRLDLAHHVATAVGLGGDPSDTPGSIAPSLASPLAAAPPSMGGGSPNTTVGGWTPEPEGLAAAALGVPGTTATATTKAPVVLRPLTAKERRQLNRLQRRVAMFIQRYQILGSC